MNHQNFCVCVLDVSKVCRHRLEITSTDYKGELLDRARNPEHRISKIWMRRLRFAVSEQRPSFAIVLVMYNIPIPEISPLLQRSQQIMCRCARVEYTIILRWCMLLARYCIISSHFCSPQSNWPSEKNSGLSFHVSIWEIPTAIQTLMSICCIVFHISQVLVFKLAWEEQLHRELVMPRLRWCRRLLIRKASS